MSDQYNAPAVPSALKRIAYIIRITAWIAFWVQLVLAVVSTIIFLFAIPFAQSGANSAAGNSPGTGGSAFFAVCALLALYFSIYQAFRYVRISRQLVDPEPNLRPKKADTLKSLRFGLMVSLGGMMLAVLGAEAITGTLLAKSLSQGQGVAVFSAESLNRLIQPLDIFVVLGNTHIITAHFVGIGASIWLIDRVDR
jgi:amino acid transporter